VIRSKRRALIVAAVALSLSSCGDPEPDSRGVLLEKCFAEGGSYFEYEATSAGGHVWCVAPDGAEIRMDGGE
jgi:putative hemolysin